MKNYGRSAIHEFLGERIVYRNLIPGDERLPTLDDLRADARLPPGCIPRKAEPDYARVIVVFLQEAQMLRGVRAAIQRVLFVGDTRLLDGTAFANICTVSGWPGLAFIGSENSKPPAVETLPSEAGQLLYLANRWTALTAFDAYATVHGLPVDEATAVILDVDKTVLGARGRNGHVIDRARVQAVQDTVAGVLGKAFDLRAFQVAYDLLNQPEFHPFTTDNQDVLAYLCLILGSGLYTLGDVATGIRRKSLASFELFMAQVNNRAGELTPELAAIHAEIYANVQRGDPTPFKAFRRNEYLRTIRCFGCLPDDTPLEKLLNEEILITQEVRAAALAWQRRGALIFGLSDKPDEAATPTPELAAQGYLPIHRAATHVAGD